MRYNGINMETSEVDVSVKQHHIRSELCVTRARYREGRHPKAVKVYTVNQESKYLLVQGIPSVGAHKDLITMFASYGHLAEYKFLDEYPTEKFTEVLLIKYKQIHVARLAKRKLDDFNFYGGTLHVCYAPEYESVQDTREKLEDRRKAVSARIRKLEEEQKTQGQTITKDSNEKPSSRSFQTTVPSFSRTATEIGSHELRTDSHLESPSKTSSNIDNTKKNILSSNTGFCGKHQVASDEVPISNAEDTYANSLQPVSIQYTCASGTMYPSQDQDNYKGPHQTPPAILGSKIERTNHLAGGNLIVRQFQSKSASTPKFVPRQVNRHQKVTHRIGQSGPRSNAAIARDTNPDPINDRLRSEALTLGKLAGPDLPAKKKEQRESFKRASTTGDELLEKTALEIRDKVKKFCEIAVPHQVKKKRRK